MVDYIYIFFKENIKYSKIIWVYKQYEIKIGISVLFLSNCKEDEGKERHVWKTKKKLS